MVSTYFLQSLVSIVDIKMVGALGQENIAALGLATSAIMVVLMSVMGLGTGTTALVARYLGEGSTDKVGLIVRQSFLISLVVALLLTAVGVFSAEAIIRFTGGKEEVITKGGDYFRILSYGSIFMTGNLIVSAILLGLGKTKTNLQILAVVNILNILGNYVLIYGVGPFPRMEIKGAATATVMARGVGLIWGFKVISSWGFGYQKFRQIFELNKEYMKKIVSIGFPVALDATNRRLQVTILNKILSYTAHGTKAISAYAVGLQAEAISFMPGLAFHSAATSLVAYNLGAKKPGRAEESSWAAVKFAAVLMSALGILLVTFSRQIIGFFTSDQTVITIGAHYLIVNGIAQPAIALNMVLSGAFRGAGDARTPLWITISALWGLRIPLAILLGITFGLGSDGVWYAMLTSIAVSGVLTLTQFKKGNWARVSI